MTQSIESATARIPVRSKRQALDWSLMLLSQEIESSIDHSELAGWGLTVATQHHGHALELIRQYRLENLGWPWRRKIRRNVLFDWGSVAWVFLLVAFFWIQGNRSGVAAAGMMDAAAVTRGEWWRLFTAIFLHADIGHLVANAGFGLVLLGLAMGAYGTGVGLLSAYLAGVGGNVLAWLIDPNHLSLGASGMVMGCVGLLAAQAVSLSRDRPRLPKPMLAGLAAGVMLFLLLGSSSSPQTDLVAHAGGFITGVLLGTLLTLTPRVTSHPAVNLLAGALFSLLVILTWRSALWQSR